MHASLPFLASFLAHATVLGMVYLAPSAPSGARMDADRFAHLVRFESAVEDRAPSVFVDVTYETTARAGGDEGGAAAEEEAAETPAVHERVADAIALEEALPPARTRSPRTRAPAPAVEPVVADGTPSHVETVELTAVEPIAESDTNGAKEASPPTATVDAASTGEPREPALAAARADGDREAAARARAPGSSGGAGAGAATGRYGTDGAGDGAGDDVDADALYARYSRSLDRIVQRNRSYPRIAQRAGLQGTVVLEVRIDPEGRILAVEVRRSSGHGVLDRAAVASIESIGAFPPPPREVAWDHRPIEIPMHYTL